MDETASGGARRAILLVDHGSRLPAANAVLEYVAEALRRRRPDVFVIVAYMELAQPSLAEALSRCVEQGAEEIVILPYFLGPGRQSARDIPQLVKDAHVEHPGLRVFVSEPLGFDERMVDVVLARVDDAVSA